MPFSMIGKRLTKKAPKILSFFAQSQNVSSNTPDISLHKPTVNPYNMFYKERISGQLKGMAVQAEETKKLRNAIVRDVADEWNSMSEDRKQEYIRQAKKFQDQWALNLLNASPTELQSLITQEAASLHRKAVLEHNKTLRWLAETYERPKSVSSSGYHLFVRENEHSVKEGAAKWSKLTEKQKEEYSVRAKKAKENYQNRLEKWQAEKDKKGRSDILKLFASDPPSLRKFEIEVRKKVAVYLGRPTGKPGPYNLFMSDELTGSLGRTDKEAFGAAAHKWNLMTDDEKKVYRTRAMKEKQERKKQLSQWEATLKPGIADVLKKPRIIRKPRKRTRTAKKVLAKKTGAKAKGSKKKKSASTSSTSKVKKIAKK